VVHRANKRSDGLHGGLILTASNNDRLNSWLLALEERHLANLTFSEVTRALRALSSTYVERRHALKRGAALDSAGKRAAFALFYGPLHLLTVRHVVAAIAARVSGGVIVDLGCGTGTAGAGWALEQGTDVKVSGLDRHRVAVEEARWTYSQLGVRGSARHGDAARTHVPAHATAVLAAYLLNEVDDATRARVWATLRAAADRGAQVLVVEPISRALTPWWNGLAREAIVAGGRADDWRFNVTLPTIVERLDRAAGLKHRELTARSLYVPGARAGG